MEEAEQIQKEILRLQSRIQSPKNQKLDGMPASHSGYTDAICTAYIQLEALQAKYGRILANMCAEQLRIEDAIETLPSVQRQLIRYRYIQGLHWPEVCVKMGYEWAQTHRIHAQALAALEKHDTQ